jgi:hypothetical protein
MTGNPEPRFASRIDPDLAPNPLAAALPRPLGRRAHLVSPPQPDRAG